MINLHAYLVYRFQKGPNQQNRPHYKLKYGMDRNVEKVLNLNVDQLK